MYIYVNIYILIFFDVHVYTHFCFVVVVETSCSGAFQYESAVICSHLEQLCRTLASWLGAVGTVQNMSKGLPLFAFEMISIQILVATDRHLNPEFWLLHCGASLVGVILTSRLAQRG